MKQKIIAGTITGLAVTAGLVLYFDVVPVVSGFVKGLFVTAGG
jgi:hypothetical protein